MSSTMTACSSVFRMTRDSSVERRSPLPRRRRSPDRVTVHREHRYGKLMITCVLRYVDRSGDPFPLTAEGIPQPCPLRSLWGSVFSRSTLKSLISS